MSTSITRDEWPKLTLVPEENWGYRWRSGKGKTEYRGCSLGPCDADPSHGGGTAYMQTPDHRAIVLCEGCFEEVMRVKS